jgi:hypothetical protein
MASTKAKIAMVVATILVAGTAFILVHHRRNTSPFSNTQELSSDENAQFVKWTGMTPEQAATNFFEACGREDWTVVAGFLAASGYPMDDNFKNNRGGLQVISMGKPFLGTVSAAGRYGGVFVPYEIRLKNGEDEKGEIALRCANPDTNNPDIHNWYVDGVFLNRDSVPH